MTRPQPEFDVLATGLRFPEGPIACADGSVLLVEIARGTLSRVAPDGSVTVVATPGGGPNGAAMGPDGACYVCNNGGFLWHEVGDAAAGTARLYPGDQPPDYSGGRIERVDLETGVVTRLYERCGDVPLRGPNDLVFDADGGFYFTDHGKIRGRERDRTGVFYARADGSHIEEIVFPLEAPNGIGLSPAGDRLYVAETLTGHLWEFALSGPGRIDPDYGERHGGGRLLPAPPGHLLYDSLAVDARGRVCVATILQGGITVVDPQEETAELIPLPDRVTTNICFGGDDLATAYVTLSSTGQLVAFPWDCPGQALAF